MHFRTPVDRSLADKAPSPRGVQPGIVRAGEEHDEAKSRRPANGLRNPRHSASAGDIRKKKDGKVVDYYEDDRNDRLVIRSLRKPWSEKIDAKHERKIKKKKTQLF